MILYHAINDRGVCVASNHDKASLKDYVAGINELRRQQEADGSMVKVRRIVGIATWKDGHPIMPEIRRPARRRKPKDQASD